MSCISTNLCSASVLKSIEGNCDNPMFSGIAQAGFLINKADIDSVGYDTDNGHVVRSLTLNSGAKAVRIVNPRNNPFTGTKTELVVGDYANTFNRTVSFYVPTDGADTAEKVIEPIAKSKFVVILENEWKNEGDVYEYQIYGLDKGLKASSMSQTVYENEGYWIVEAIEESVPTSGKWIEVLTADTTGTYALTIATGATSEKGVITFTDSSTAATLANIVCDGLNFTATYGEKKVKGVLAYTPESTSYSYSLSGENGKVIVTMTGSGATFTTSEWSGTVSVYNDTTCSYLTALLSVQD